MVTEDIPFGTYLALLVLIIAAVLVGVALWSQVTAPTIVAEDAKRISTGSLPPLGAEDAPAVLVLFGNFENEFYAPFFKNIEARLREVFITDGELVMYWRDYPVLGEQSTAAARAARCAAEQGAFWPYHDALALRDQETYISLAEDIGLNTVQFRVCLAEARYTREIEADAEAARARGVQGTPTVFIGVRDGEHTIAAVERVVGAQPYRVYERAINHILDNR